MRNVILALLLLVGVTPANAEVPQAPNSPGSSSGTLPTIVAALRSFVVPPVRPAPAAELQHLTKAIGAIESAGVKMTAARRLQIARAALKASVATGVDSTLLIAVARTESDFRGLQVVDWRCRSPRYRTCRADCGITQHYISGSRGWVIRRCRKLAEDYDLSFHKSAEELAHHIAWCRKHPRYHKPLERCVLNRYNGGPYYPTPKRCEARLRDCRATCPRLSWVYDPAITEQEDRQYRYQHYQRCRSACTGVQRKCRRRANYWLVVLCFDHGARTGQRAVRSCRSIWKRTDITTRFYRSALKPTDPPTTASR